MKKIITAIGNPEINNKLSKEKNIKIIGKDIQYQEAVLELLEKNIIDILIIHEKMLNQKRTEEEIRRIKQIDKKIQIILITHQQEKKEILLKEKNINIICCKVINEDLLIKIKEIIKNNYKNKYIQINNEKRLKKKNINKNISKKEVIIVTGEKEIGKSTIIMLFAEILKKEKTKKILIIDFNLLNQKCSSIYRNYKYPKKVYQKINQYKIHEKNKKNNKLIKNIKQIYIKNNEKIIKNFITKRKNSIDVLYGLELIFVKNGKIQKEETDNFIKQGVKKLKEIYDVIFIDIGLQEYEMILNKESSLEAKTIVLIEPTLLGIKRGKRIAETIKKRRNENKKSLHIVANKYDKVSIEKTILKYCFNYEIFSGRINRQKIKKEKMKKKFFGRRMIKDGKKVIKKIII